MSKKWGRLPCVNPLRSSSNSCELTLPTFTELCWRKKTFPGQVGSDDGNSDNRAEKLLTGADLGKIVSKLRQCIRKSKKSRKGVRKGVRKVKESKDTCQESQQMCQENQEKFQERGVHTFLLIVDLVIILLVDCWWIDQKYCWLMMIFFSKSFVDVD